MITFIPIEDYNKFIVNHIDGNKQNNYIGNLEWCTHSENRQHAYKIGLQPKGEDHGTAVLKNEQVEIICQRLSEGKSYSDCAISAGIEPKQSIIELISLIKKRKTWRFISDKYEFPNERSVRLLNDSEIHKICKLIAEEKSSREIFNTLGDEVSFEQLQRIVKNLKNKSVCKYISDLYF